MMQCEACSYNHQESYSLLTSSTLNSFSEGMIDNFVLCSWVDQMRNVHCRVDGSNVDVEALLICSHIVDIRTLLLMLGCLMDP